MKLIWFLYLLSVLTNAQGWCYDDDGDFYGGLCRGTIEFGAIYCFELGWSCNARGIWVEPGFQEPCRKALRTNWGGGVEHYCTVDDSKNCCYYYASEEMCTSIPGCHWIPNTTSANKKTMVVAIIISIAGLCILIGVTYLVYKQRRKKTAAAAEGTTSSVDDVGKTKGLEPTETSTNNANAEVTTGTYVAAVLKKSEPTEPIGILVRGSASGGGESRITKITMNSLAYKSDLQVGMIIKSIDNIDCTNKTPEEIVQLLKQATGTFTILAQMGEKKKAALPPVVAHTETPVGRTTTAVVPPSTKLVSLQHSPAAVPTGTTAKRGTSKKKEVKNGAKVTRKLPDDVPGPSSAKTSKINKSKRAKINKTDERDIEKGILPK